MLALGIPTKRELLRRLLPQDLMEWRAFERLEPWGCAVWDHRFNKTIQAITKDTTDHFPGYADYKFDLEEEALRKPPEEDWKRIQSTLNMGFEIMAAGFDN